MDKSLKRRVRSPKPFVKNLPRSFESDGQPSCKPMTTAIGRRYPPLLTASAMSPPWTRPKKVSPRLLRNVNLLGEYSDAVMGGSPKMDAHLEAGSSMTTNTTNHLKLGWHSPLSYLARPTGIEPVSRASETLILSIELRARGRHCNVFAGTFSGCAKMSATCRSGMPDKPGLCIDALL